MPRQSNAATIAQSVSPGRVVPLSGGHSVRVRSVSSNGPMLEVVLESDTVPLNNPYFFLNPPIKAPSGAGVAVVGSLGVSFVQRAYAIDAATSFDREVAATVRSVARKRGVRV